MISSINITAVKVRDIFLIFLLSSLVSSNIFRVTFSSVFILFFGIFSPANISLIDTANISLSFINTEESGIVIPVSLS